MFIGLNANPKALKDANNVKGPTSPSASALSGSLRSLPESVGSLKVLYPKSGRARSHGPKLGLDHQGIHF